MRPSAPAPRELRICALISGAGSTLANLLQHVADGRLRGVTFCRVISSRREVRGVAIARQAGLPVTVIRPRDYPTRDAFDAAMRAALLESGADLAVMCGYMLRLGLPDAFRGRVLNIHPALLPQFGGTGMYGRRVHEAVIASGATRSGCTVHVADDEYDHGPIIAQAFVDVGPAETAESLEQKVQAAERELYPRVIGEIATRGIEWLARRSDIGSRPSNQG
ncbi:MAG: Phosphoribosylglycinamide formyltransferase [Phycisphaerae bacterium]|nr:Phosphoribosylglycinamide formyltransferase [Phycisphaerae bacterium]